MKKLIYLMVVIVALGLIASGCIPVVPPVEQNEPGTLPTKNPGVLNVPSVLYPTIQAAIDAAIYGDTIIVHPGTYSEEVEIAKALTLQGIGWPTIEAPLGLHSNAIWIGASDVTVTGFRLKAPDDIVDINPYNLT